MKYDVVTSDSLTVLIDKVNEKLAEGWMPSGGIAWDALCYRWAQAITYAMTIPAPHF